MLPNQFDFAEAQAQIRTNIDHNGLHRLEARLRQSAGSARFPMDSGTRPPAFQMLGRAYITPGGLPEKSALGIGAANTISGAELIFRLANDMYSNPPRESTLGIPTSQS